MSRNRSVDHLLKRVVGISLAVVVVAVFTGYAVFRHQTPVTREDAVNRFRAHNDATTSGRYEVDPSRDRRRTRKGRGVRRDLVAAVRSGNSSSSASKDAASDDTATTAVEMTDQFDVMPAEGVYTYVGRGQESIHPVPPRAFPRVTQRIITHHDHNTWVEHHIFSEERASWTQISTSETGRLAHNQRNYIRIGPYDEDKMFPFEPPIRGVIFPHFVGQSWEGRFKGQTNDGEDYTGRYTVRAVDDSTWNVGGVDARVLGLEFSAEMEGEFNGTVTIKFWFAPRYGLTVREEYYADAKVGALTYWGEWFVELRSLKPRT